MKKEIWQTTNQDPWVYALANGIISIKTRTSRPCVPNGAIVLLHTSKSKLWRFWRYLKWTSKLNPSDFQRG